MMPDLFVLARVLHVASIVGWIGGVWFVTFVIMPAITRSEPPALRMSAFHRIEQGFSRQAKFWVLLAGLSGFWMTEQAGLWSRFAQAHYWWMHAMVAVWLLFTLMLFVAEPLFLHRWFQAQAERRPAETFALIERLHRFLLTISLLTVLGAVAGSHGFGF